MLGASGMLGHKLWQVLGETFETWGTVRSTHSRHPSRQLFASGRIMANVDATDFDSVVRAVARVRPQAVVNAIGVIKQLPAAKDPITCLTINSLFPHRLAKVCEVAGARLVHISTDCVFSGRKGMYTEDDMPDAEDLYGRSKLLGEISESGALTLRTSIIGRELASGNGLIEWLLAQRGGSVQGYEASIFSGLTTISLAQVVADLICRFPDLSGLYHVSSQPISKHDLLCLIRDATGLQLEIERVPGPRCDRSLNSTRFRETTGLQSPSWPQLVRDMFLDPTPYEKWRTQIDS